MQVSGKIVIVVILTASITAAAFSWWYRWQATHRAAAFWGTQAIAILQGPEKITAMRLGSSRDEGDESAAGEDAPSDSPAPTHFYGHAVEAAKDVSSAGGMTHLRQALIEDRSFDWSGEPPSDAPSRYALVFTGPANTGAVRLLFSEDFQRIDRVNGNGDPDGNPRHDATAVEASIAVSPIASGLRQYFAEILPENE